MTKWLLYFWFLHFLRLRILIYKRIYNSKYDKSWKTEKIRILSIKKLEKNLRIIKIIVNLEAQCAIFVKSSKKYILNFLKNNHIWSFKKFENLWKSFIIEKLWITRESYGLYCYFIEKNHWKNETFNIKNMYRMMICICNSYIKRKQRCLT